MKVYETENYGHEILRGELALIRRCVLAAREEIDKLKRIELEKNSEKLLTLFPPHSVIIDIKNAYNVDKNGLQTADDHIKTIGDKIVSLEREEIRELSKMLQVKFNKEEDKVKLEEEIKKEEETRKLEEFKKKEEFIKREEIRKKNDLKEPEIIIEKTTEIKVDLSPKKDGKRENKSKGNKKDDGKDTKKEEPKKDSPKPNPEKDPKSEKPKQKPKDKK